MADVLRQIAVAAELQTTDGQLADGLAAITTGAPVAIADGIIMGVPESGEARSGVSLVTEAQMREVQSFPGDRAMKDGHFVQERLSTFQIQAAMSGSRRALVTGGNTDPTEYQHQPGYDALLVAAGLQSEQNVGATHWQYAAGGSATDYISLCHYAGADAGHRTVVIDALVGTTTFQFTPGEVPLVTWDIQGTVDDATGAFTFPATVDFSPMDTVAPPIVELVASTFAGNLRPYTDLSIVIDNNIQDIPDSNVEGGRRIKGGFPQTFTVSGTFIVSDADFDAEWQAMTAAGEAAVDLTFLVGAITSTIGEPTVSTDWLARNVRVLTHNQVEVEQSGCSGITFTARANAATSTENEFLLQLR